MDTLKTLPQSLLLLFDEAAVLIVPNTDDSWKRAPRVVVLFFIFF